MERENRFLEEEEDDDEDYIDMDISSIKTPPKSLEFEFHPPTTIPNHEESISISPADELFYRGKLLPLHLPPRLEMVENISLLKKGEEKRVAAQVKDTRERIPWSKRLRHMSKASGAYVKSIFYKSASSDEEKKTSVGSSKQGRKNHLFWKVRGVHGGKEETNVLKQEAYSFNHRSSFSGAIHHKNTETKRLCPSSPPFSSSSPSSSSSSSSSSYTSRLMPMLQRSNSMNSEGEISIQGAITYCKNSMGKGRKSESNHLQCSNSVSRIAAACESIDKKPGICRG